MMFDLISIVPLGRGHFPHDSRHFVPGHYRAVPPYKSHSPIEAPDNYLSAYGVNPGLNGAKIRNAWDLFVPKPKGMRI
jgi:hypothetical protein